MTVHVAPATHHVAKKYAPRRWLDHTPAADRGCFYVGGGDSGSASFGVRARHAYRNVVSRIRIAKNVKKMLTLSINRVKLQPQYLVEKTQKFTSCSVRIKGVLLAQIGCFDNTLFVGAFCANPANSRWAVAPGMCTLQIFQDASRTQACGLAISISYVSCC